MDPQQYVIDSSLIEHHVKICVNDDCGVVVLNKDWKETSCRQCGTRIFKINAKTFKKKFINNKQIVYLDL